MPTAGSLYTLVMQRFKKNTLVLDKRTSFNDEPWVR